MGETTPSAPAKVAIFSTSGCQEHGDFCLPPLLCAGPSLIILQALQMCWTGCEPMYCYDVCKPVPHTGHSRYSDVVYFHRKHSAVSSASLCDEVGFSRRILFIHTQT